MKNKFFIFKLIIIFYLIKNISNSWDYTLQYPNKPLKGSTPLENSGRASVLYISENNYVTSWDAIAQKEGNIYYAILNTSLQVVKSTTKVNTNTPLANALPSIALDGQGGFVIMWYNGKSPTVWNSANIYVKYFDSSYTETGPEIQIPYLTASAFVKDSKPSIIRMSTSGNFIACNNGRIQQFTKTTTGNQKSVEISPDVAIEKCQLCDLKNGTFAITFQYVLNTYFGVMNESDFSFVKEITELPEQELIFPRITYLSSSQFAMIRGNRTNMFVQIFDLAGNQVGNQFQVNDTSPVDTPSIKNMGTKGFWVAYGTSTTMIYKFYNNNGTPNGSEVNVIEKYRTTLCINIDDNVSTAMMVDSDGIQIFAWILKLTTPTTPPCSSLSLLIGKVNPKVKVPFDTTDTNANVYITALPNGLLTNYAGNTLSANTQYLETDVYYNISNPPASDSFSYTNSLGDKACSVTITPCYISCGSCTIVGSSTDHKCTACNSVDKYYALENKPTQCFMTASPPDEYYLDNSIWKKCYKGCLTCSGLCKTCTGTPSDPPKDMLCKPYSCISGYYPKIDNTTSCFNGDIEGYYFDGSIYQKCYLTCLTCTNVPGTQSNTQGISSDHQCSSCLVNYFPKIDYMTSCFTGDQDGYYFDGTIYQSCFSTCKTCTNMPGTASNHQCMQCKQDYYPKIDNMSSCFTGVLNGYYLDENIYKICDTDCLAKQHITLGNNNTISDINLDASCEPPPCLNGGKCSIILNNIQCSCLDNFLGSICQYEKSTINIDEIINNFYQTHSEQLISDLLSIIATNPNLINKDKLNKIYQDISIFPFNLVAYLNQNNKNNNFYYIFMLNLAMLIQSKLKATTESIRLKSMATGFSEKLLLSSKLDKGKNLIAGNLMFSSQIYLSGNNTEIEEASLKNNFPIFDLQECEKILKNFYNLTESDSILYMTNNFKVLNDTNPLSSHTISAYSSETKEKLNLDFCKNATQIIQLPINNIDQYNMTLYREMKNKGIDIFDPNNTYFNDICFSYIDNSSDTTLNYRRQNYFQPTIPECSGLNCEYNGINENNYVGCTCGIQTGVEYINKPLNYVLESLSQFNFEVVKCTAIIPVYIY
jgi:hypothetical protein